MKLCPVPSLLGTHGTINNICPSLLPTLYFSFLLLVAFPISHFPLSAITPNPLPRRQMSGSHWIHRMLSGQPGQHFTSTHTPPAPPEAYSQELSCIHLIFTEEWGWECTVSTFPFIPALEKGILTLEIGLTILTAALDFLFLGNMSKIDDLMAIAYYRMIHIDPTFKKLALESKRGHLKSECHVCVKPSPCALI